MNAKLALALVALLALGAAVAPTATADPTCQDLAGQGSACVDATVDPSGPNVNVAVSVNVVVNGP